MNREYTFFWGCTIQAKFPFMEKATRLVLDKLNIKYKDIDSFTCCPEKSLIKNIDENLFDLTGIRNIALAEKQNADIISVVPDVIPILSRLETRLLPTFRIRKKLTKL
jgi:Heterodisulfide reductase, subunit B